MIDDPISAIREAKTHLQIHQGSKSLHLAHIKALCQAGLEIEALEEWNTLSSTHEDLLNDRTALEMLAWGVLNKGEASNQLSIKINSLIGASMTRDAKAIPLILNGLRGTNSMVRALCVSLAAAYGDLPLQAELARLIQDEEVWSVRLELIKAAGQLRMKNTKTRLLEIISHPRTLAEEKVAAIISIVNMYDAIEDKELASLVRSNRAGIRELSCQIVSHLDLQEKIPMLLPLLADTHPGVRMSMLNTLALMGIKKVDGKPLMDIQQVSRLLNDQIPEVVITASYLALLHGDKRGEHNLKHWILNGEDKYARLAAAALAASGKRGVSLSKTLLKKSNSPYVQISLALGLIGQQQNVDFACSVIEKHLALREKWMWDASLNPLFRSVASSKVTHNAQIPNYPAVVNQMTRIELLQILCIMKYKGAQFAVKEFLQADTWGPVGAAAATLIQEGDDEALDVIRSLLKDPEEKVRIQSALILAMLGGDKKAVKVLKDAYSGASREIKLQILQAITQTKDPKAISFLLDRLNEPFQVLRVVAATGIIQCLYQ